MVAAFEIEDLLLHFRFDALRRVSTRAGERMVRSALIPPNVKSEFWKSWNDDKAEWAGRGYAVAKYGADWKLTQWLSIDGGVTEQALEKARLAREESAEGALPADWIPDDVQLVTPNAKRLLHYQVPAALRLKRALGLGNALDASETGVGKTFVALVVAKELGLTPCVIAPLAVLPSWRRAADYLGVTIGWLVNYDKIRGGKSGLGRWKELPSGKGKTFIYDYLPANPLLIFDECHKASSPTTLQGGLLRSAAFAKIRTLCLSATAAKDPTDMRNLGAALDLHDGTAEGFAKFCADYGCFSSQYGMKFDKKKRRLLEKLHRKIFPLKGNRLRVEDIADFPETSILAETLTCDTKAIQSAYDAAEMKIQALEANQSLSALDRGASVLAAITAARKAAEKGKLDLFEELAKEAISEGRSVVLFLNFRDHIDELRKRLKTECVIWGTDLHGRAQSPVQRQNHIDNFNSDKDRVCIVSLMAGGAGLSLHDLNGNHPRVALISPSYSIVDLKQCLGRIHRAGAKTKSFQRIILAADTIEEEICKSLREKLANLDTLNNGDLIPSGVALRLTEAAKGTEE